MKLELKPLHPLFVAEASGIALAQPLEPDAVRAIDAAMDQYAVLVWRNQPMTPEEQLRFASSLGRLDSGLKKVFKRKERLPYEELIDISNVGYDGKVVAAWEGGTATADLRIDPARIAVSRIALTDDGLGAIEDHVADGSKPLLQAADQLRLVPQDCRAQPLQLSLAQPHQHPVAATHHSRHRKRHRRVEPNQNNHQSQAHQPSRG
jgi:alpha-ketoglutarate-dependent taurine dioxygenase